MAVPAPPWRHLSFAAAAVLAGVSACGDELAPVLGDDTSPGEVQAIFNESCVNESCHFGPGSPSGLDLTAPARDDLVGVESSQVTKPLVDPFDVANSYLYDKVVGMMIAAGTDPMPPPPFGALPPEDIDIIFEWIESGAP